MNRKVALLAGGGILAIIAVWYAMLFSPQSSALSQANQRLDAARQHQTELRAQLRALTLAKSTSAAVEAQIAALKQAIPDRANLATFIDAANGAAAASGIDIASIAPTQPAATKAAGLQELRITMAVKGTYFQVIDFVNRLDAMQRLIVVDGVNLSSDKAGGVSGQLNFRMFTAPAKTPVTSGAKP